MTDSTFSFRATTATSGSFCKFDFLIGYEPLGKRYRKLLSHNVGVVIKDCTLEGSRLIVNFPKGAHLESGGHKILFRQSYDWAEPGKVRKLNQRVAAFMQIQTLACGSSYLAHLGSTQRSLTVAARIGAIL